MAALALWRHRLKAARDDPSAYAAQRVLTAARLAEPEAGDGGRERVVTAGMEQARKVLKIQRKPPPRELAQAHSTAEGKNAVSTWH